MLHLAKAAVPDFMVQLPSEDDLQVYDAMASPSLLSAGRLRTESEALAAVRDALLPKLVSGQIRVPLSDDVEEAVGAAIEALA